MQNLKESEDNNVPEENFERVVLDRLTRIEVKLDSYDKLKDQVYDNQRNIILLNEKCDQQQKDINDLKDRNKWLARSIVGAVIVAGVSIITLFIKMGMGV